MEKIYTTKLVLNGTNLSFTVPLSLVKQAKIQQRTYWQWSDIITPGSLMLVPFQGTLEQAIERKRLYGDVVFLQQMKRQNGSSQYKINLPRWIYDNKKLTGHIVKMTWTKTADGEIHGKIMLSKQETVNDNLSKQETVNDNKS